jgi:hypothetical protein
MSAKKKKVNYGPFEKAVNGIIRGMQHMKIAPAGTKADGDPGAKFDEGVAEAKCKTEDTRAFLHLLMFHVCVANPSVQTVPMHRWSPEAEQVLATLKQEAAADRRRNS